MTGDATQFETARYSCVIKCQGIASFVLLLLFIWFVCIIFFYLYILWLSGSSSVYLRSYTSSMKRPWRYIDELQRQMNLISDSSSINKSTTPIILISVIQLFFDGKL